MSIVEALKAQIAEQTALIYSLYNRIKELQDETILKDNKNNDRSWQEIHIIKQ